MSYDSRDGERCLLFDCGDEGSIQVLPRCPVCQRYIAAGKVLVNGLGDVSFNGWTCKRDGEVSPEWGSVWE